MATDDVKSTVTETQQLGSGRERPGMEREAGGSPAGRRRRRGERHAAVARRERRARPLGAGGLGRGSRPSFAPFPTEKSQMELRLPVAFPIE